MTTLLKLQKKKSRICTQTLVVINKSTYYEPIARYFNEKRNRINQEIEQLKKHEKC